MLFRSAFRVVHGVTGHLLSCVWNLRVFPDDAQGCQCPRSEEAHARIKISERNINNLRNADDTTPACLSSCSQSDRPLVELCVEPAGFSGRCTGVSVPLRVVPSSTRLPSKRCPGIGFFSRAYQKIGVFQHVVPPTRLRLEFPRETGLILRCAGKLGNPLQTKQGNRPTARDQKGRRGSDEVVPGTSVVPSSETGMSRHF